jgi:hypothetical protein
MQHVQPTAQVPGNMTFLVSIRLYKLSLTLPWLKDQSQQVSTSCPCGNRELAKLALFFVLDLNTVPWFEISMCMFIGMHEFQPSRNM